MPKVLISYRRSDAAGVAGRIFDRLVARYGHDSIFMDVDHIPFGTDFRVHIRETLLAGDVLLAIVGTRWLGQRTGECVRMHEANDPVRVEIETALAQGLPVIPVLVDGAAMPMPDELPEALAQFCYRNAAVVDIGRDFHQHMDRLIRTIDRVLDAKTHAAPASAAPEGARNAPMPAAMPAMAAPVPPPRRRWMFVVGVAVAAAAIVLLLALGITQWSGPSSAPGSADLRTPFASPSGPPVRIGLAAALSGPGEPLGREVALAMKIWREDTNVRGGLLGRPVELVLRDDEGQPFNAPSLFARLIELDKADVLISAGSGFSISLAMPDGMKSNKVLFGLFGMQANSQFSYTPTP
jgi:Periplasmic binding protein/TIR domain